VLECITLKGFISWSIGNDCMLCVQVIMKLMEMMDQSSDFVSMLVKKLAPPLVTLLSAEPEIQYVALRNINLVVQKRYIGSAFTFLTSVIKELTQS